MTTTTSPDGIIRWTLSDASSLASMSTSISNSIQTAFDKRERYDFVWNDQSGRTEQTTMVRGSRGYQLDTQTDWVYDGANWQIVRAHTEYTFGNEAIDSGVVTGAGTLTMDTSQSTSSTQTSTTTIGGTGQIIFVNAGVYAYHAITVVGGENGTEGEFFQGRTFIECNLGGSNVVGRQNGVTNETIVGLSLANLRIPADNTSVFTRIYQTSGAELTFEGRIRVTRIN